MTGSSSRAAHTCARPPTATATAQPPARHTAPETAPATSDSVASNPPRASIPSQGSSARCPPPLTVRPAWITRCKRILQDAALRGGLGRGDLRGRGRLLPPRRDLVVLHDDNDFGKPRIEACRFAGSFMGSAVSVRSGTIRSSLPSGRDRRRLPSGSLNMRDASSSSRMQSSNEAEPSHARLITAGGRFDSGLPG
jgi:hypothetical protein